MAGKAGYTSRAMPHRKRRKKVTASRFQLDVLALLKLVAKHGGAQLTCNQMIILGEVWTAFSADRELCISDIQQLCQMPKATASRSVSNLAEGLGFIDLQVDPNDKRRKFLLPSARLVQLDRKMSREFRKYWDATRA